MSQEREYNHLSLNRVDTLHKVLVQNNQRIERNKQVIDNYILADPSRIDEPEVISKSDITRSQDEDNIEEAKEFAETYYHELVDIALAEAAKAGKTIVDARDDFEAKQDEPPVTEESLFANYGNFYVPEKQDITQARQGVVLRYCAQRGINPNDMTVEQLMEARALPEWQDPFNKQ